MPNAVQQRQALVDSSTWPLGDPAHALGSQTGVAAVALPLSRSPACTMLSCSALVMVSMLWGPRTVRDHHDGSLVVGHSTVGRGVLAYADNASALALLGVANEDLLPELLPSVRCDTRRAWSQLVAAFVCCLGITWGIAAARGQTTEG